MQLYQHKELDYCFVIVCIDESLSLLKNTINSIALHHSQARFTAVVPKRTHAQIIENMSAICDILVAGDTITSLVNEGIKKAPASWAFIVFSGSLVRPRMDEKFSFYIESEKDILFPVAERKSNFVEGTMNGMLVHKDTFSLVGDMSTDQELSESKAFWAYEAMSNGCRFKAIVGGKIC